MKHRLSRPALYLAVILFSALYLLPVFFAFQRSLEPSTGAAWVEELDAARGPGGLQNYAIVLSSDKLPGYFRSSIIITGATIIGTLLVTVPAAYAFSKLRFRGKNLFFTLFMVAILLPVTAVVVPLFTLVRKLNLINNPLGVIGPYIAFGFPYFMLILRNFFDELPGELIDSARIDGCTQFQVLWKIILPLSKPALVVVVLFTFLNTWNEFLLAFLFLKKPEWHTVTLAPMQYASQYTTQWNLTFATIIILAIPATAVFFVLQRWYIQGLTAGSLKG